jgi:hypothetical protein
LFEKDELWSFDVEELRELGKEVRVLVEPAWERNLPG